MNSELVDFVARCRALGEAFRGRLEDEVLDDALEYLDFNESVLALDVLASQLYEYGVEVERAEVVEFQDLLTRAGGDRDRVEFLFELVITDSREVGFLESTATKDRSTPEQASGDSEPLEGDASDG